MHTSATTLTTGLLLAAAGSNALELNINSTSSIKTAAKTIAGNVVHIYNQSLSSTGIPGLLETPYYWWTGGLMFDSLINYWALTGDASYNDLISQGLLEQIGSKPYYNFEPSNQTASEGNDDQSTWGLAAMTAAEKGFPAPSESSGVQSWVELAENVFNSQAARWDTSHCGGGLRWQIFEFNAGYNYKNSASNGNFLQLAGRLAHYTRNKTYADWAQRTAKWSMSVDLIRQNWQINDGADISNNCSNANAQQWTDNYGDYLGGWAYMANYTWNSDVPKLVSKINDIFVKNGILTEVTCLPTNNCNTDSTFFRAILARALANTAAMVPSVSDSITSILRSSAEGAAGQCSGTSSGTACGTNWNTTKYDGTTGLGQELSALEIILANLPAAKPETEDSSSTTTTSTAVPSGSASMTASSTASSTTASQSPVSSSTTPSGNAATTSPSVAGDVRVSSLGGMAAVGLAMAVLA